MADEIAAAYVALYTKFGDSPKKAIENELGKVDAEGAGGKLGEGLGKGISNKQAAIAGAVGGIFASVANMAAQAVGDLFADAVDMSDATDKFQSTLSFANLDTSAIDQAVKDSRDYADSTVYDLGTIQNTTAQLAANGISNYSQLTEAAGNLNAVAGGNADTFKSVAMMLTQTAGQGKLTTENWNQLADAIPGASGRLQSALEEAGAYTGNFRDAMSEGQITADEFNAALLQLGSEPVAVEAATSVSTMEGATGNLAASITGRLADAFTTIKPLLTGLTSAFADFISNSQIFIPVISGVGAALLVALAPSIWAAVTATWAFTTALLANPLTWVALAVGALVAAIVLLAMNWDTVVAWISDVWGGFIWWITGVIDGFVGWWNDTWAAVGQVFSDIWNGFVDIVKGIWNGIIGFVEGGINSVIDLINGMIDGVNVVGGAFGVHIDAIPKVALPGLANGGTITRPGSVIVGENGPELLRLPRGASVDPNIAGSGSVEFNVHPGPGMDEATIGRVAANEFAWQMRRA